MEQNLPVIAKKFWSLMRVMFFMLKKGINSKTKFFTHLNVIIKRGKIAGKSLQNLLFHHHHNWANSATFHRQLPSGTNTPLSLSSQHSVTTPEDDDIDEMIRNSQLLLKALDMLTSQGYGESPVVKQLRITDSPFPLTNGDEGGDQVDEAAEKFIMRFYNGLRRQN